MEINNVCIAMTELCETKVAFVRSDWWRDLCAGLGEKRREKGEEEQSMGSERFCCKDSSFFFADLMGFVKVPRTNFRL